MGRGGSLNAKSPGNEIFRAIDVFGYKNKTLNANLTINIIESINRLQVIKNNTLLKGEDK